MGARFGTEASPHLYVFHRSIYTLRQCIGLSIDFFVSLIAAHLADSVFKHYILLEQVVHRNLVYRIVVLRALQEEAQEALCTITACTGSQVAEQHQVKIGRAHV